MSTAARKTSYTVRKGRIKAPRFAECVDCSWSLEAGNALGTAFRHAKYSGHRVQVVVRDVVVFQPNVERGM